MTVASTDAFAAEWIARRQRTLERYWSAFHVDLRQVDGLVAGCFTERARFESAVLAEPVVGRQAIGDHVAGIRALLAEATVRRHTEVQWTHRSARWCWAWRGPSGVGRGMDVVRFAPGDDRIELLIVFAGLLPPPR